MSHPLILDVLMVFWLLMLVLFVLCRIIDALDREFRRPRPRDYRHYERNRKIRM